VPDFSGEEAASVEGFQFQWEKRRAGEFETETLYGKTIEDEEAQFFQYLGLRQADVHGKLVLDAGCGSGRLVTVLASQGIDVVGIDLTSTVFAIDQKARERGLDNLTLVRGNLRAIPIRSSTFDCIWSGGVIHHTGDTREALQNLVKVLKPGGTLYVWVYSIEQGIFGYIRQLLPFVHGLPKPLLLGLCRILAVPVYGLGHLTGRAHPMPEVRFKLFDHLGPRYRTVHSETEMIDWFRAEGLEQIEIVIPQHTGGVGIRGRRPA
jgi:SAM-dependent methyltransferase